MINLLPNDVKRQIRAAHWNIDLRRYMIILIFALIFLAVISVGVYLILMDTKANAERLTQTHQAHVTTNATTESQAAAFKSNLTTAKSILDQQVLYTKIIAGIAQALPNGVILDGLSLNPTIIGSATTLKAHAKTDTQALSILANFQASQLFSNVSVQSLSQDKTDTTTAYPWSVTIGLTINKVVTQ